MHNHDTAGTSWWDLALLSSVKVNAEAVAAEASPVGATVRGGAGVWSVATVSARVPILAVAFPRITVAVLSTAVHCAQINASVVHLQVEAAVARDALGRAVLGARGPAARDPIRALAHVRFAHGVDPATRVALGTQALVHVDAIHAWGLRAATRHPCTLVHVLAKFVAPAADPSLGAEALEPVLLVDAVACATTRHIAAALCGAAERCCCARPGPGPPGWRRRR